MANYHKTVLIAILLIGLIGLAIHITIADPGGPTITYLGNSSLDTSSGTNLSHAGGAIHIISISAVLQNDNWKAYVGNVTGQLTLDDASDYTIYDWTLATVSGEVYITRDSSVTWSSIACGNTANITAEQNQLRMQSNAIDNINITFNNSVHESFLVAGTNISRASCPTAYTYVNDSRQNDGDIANKYEEVLLTDGTNIVYTTILEQNTWAYSGNNHTYDFQAIVGENVSAAGADIMYYFFVELG